VNGKLNDVLGQIQISLAEEILKRIKDGSATAADLQVARGLLRDNNIQALPEANPGLMRLADSLPFDDTDAEAAVG
jgi:hypothetical protein